MRDLATASKETIDAVWETVVGLVESKQHRLSASLVRRVHIDLLHQTSNVVHNCKCINLDCSGHDSWYTPFDLLCKIRQVFTGNQIDLDPCSDPIAQQTVQAMTYFTKESDGLSKDWFGRVFVNPPFGLLGGKSQQGMFASKALEEYNQKRASEVSLLLKASVGYSWVNTVMEHPHGFLRSRVAFTCPQRASELIQYSIFNIDTK